MGEGFSIEFKNKGKSQMFGKGKMLNIGEGADKVPKFPLEGGQKNGIDITK